MMLTRTSDKKTALRARDALVRAGFIEYKRGKRGRATEYRLLEYGGKSLPENATVSATISATENTTPNKNKTETKKKTFFSGGDGGAAPAPTPAPEGEAATAVAEYLTDRGIDKSLYFGVTDEIMMQAEKIAREIFSNFTTKEPVESDIAKVFDYTHEREGVREETRISFSEERIKLLAYAFEQAADAGKPGNWRYIGAVMGRLGQRGIKTIEQAEDYDYERDCRKGF